MNEPSRRQFLVTAAVLGTLALGGCLTLNPSVMANTDDSTVFKRLSVDESWSSQRVRTTVSLRSTSAADDVTRITVIKENGKTFSTAKLATGQTSVTLLLPPNQNATIVASDSINGTTIETMNVSTGGNTIL